MKIGRTGPLDFTWFPKVFPRRKLLVISNSEFQSSQIKGITIEQFLLADGFPHPYPGPVNDPDMYNGAAILSLTDHHVLTKLDLPQAHSDPFDRLLLGVAASEHMILLTADAALVALGVQDARLPLKGA